MHKTKIDLKNWNRKEHFEFFNQMDEPFYGVTVSIDCTQAFQTAKSIQIPFFTYYLHKTLMAVNAVENFRLRIIDKKVYLFDRIDASVTILREDKTFGFSFMEFLDEIHNFQEIVSKETLRVQNTTGLFTRDFPLINLIHFSAIPWIDFTSLSHARGFAYEDSCPKISFGKLTKEDEKYSIPMSIHVHHGLVDGYHLGLFIDEFQRLMRE